MSDPVARRQGQPILFLGLLLVGWCLVRVLTWQNPWPEVESLTEPMMLAGAGFDAATRDAEIAHSAGSFVGRSQLASEESAERRGRTQVPSVLSASKTSPSVHELSRFAPEPAASPDGTIASVQFPAASTPGQPVARKAAQSQEIEDGASQPSTAGQRPLPRWRFDAWALLREGGGARIETGNAPASYGASQAGGVLAYRLAPSSRFRPAAYLRASRALITGGEPEGALGLRARPFERLPIDFHVEARAIDRPWGLEVRPAAFVAGGIDDANLPARVRLRGYAQAGYVHGDFATAFADGKLVAERELVGFSTGSASLGAGGWGGAQKGAHRLDIGPTLSLDFKLGKTPAKLEADYRFRIAGNAEPGNGGVLTLSTGF